MRKYVILAVVIMLMSLVSAAQAGINASSYSVTPFIGGYVFEGNEQLKNSYTLGLRAGYNFTKEWGVEGYFHYIPTEVRNVTDAAVNIQLYSYGIEGIYHFLPESRLVPFLAVGFGQINYRTKASYEEMNKTSVDYGAGLKYFLKDDIALRADVRHVLPLSNTYNDLLFTVGITFPFGGEKKTDVVARAQEPVLPAAPVTVVKDSDKDGVPDNLDKCPDTPAGIMVDQDGCPPDTDRDGVPDYLDKCPGTPAGVAVDQDGCPVVVEQKQKAEAAPAPVVAKHLPKKIYFSIRVGFDTDKAFIKKQYRDDIKEVADFMKEYPYTKAVIEGHADRANKSNKKNYNIQLSRQRAKSVRQYLIDKFGIAASRLTAVGYGPNRPIANNKTNEGRQKNRRVRVVIDTIGKNKA